MVGQRVDFLVKTKINPLLSKVVKNKGFLCTKEPLKLYGYVTMELVVCFVYS